MHHGFPRTALRGFGLLVPAFGESLALGREESALLLTIMAGADFASRSQSSPQSPPYKMLPRPRLLMPLLTDCLLPDLSKKWLFITYTLGMAAATGLYGRFSPPVPWLTPLWWRRLSGPQLPLGGCCLRPLRSLHRRGGGQHECHLRRFYGHRNYSGAAVCSPSDTF